jgi:hypothetical protein
MARCGPQIVAGAISGIRRYSPTGPLRETHRRAFLADLGRNENIVRDLFRFPRAQRSYRREYIPIRRQRKTRAIAGPRWE